MNKQVFLSQNTIPDYLTMKKILWTMILPLVLSACGEDREVEFKDRTDVNDWIYGVMKDMYFWSDNMGSSASRFAVPETYFKNLKSSSDKVSYMVIAGDSTDYSYGIDYTTYSMKSESGRLAVRVMNVEDGSPAARAGLKRGEWILTVNGKKINSNNVSSLDCGGELSLEITPLISLGEDGNEVWESTTVKSVPGAEVLQTPAIHMDSLYSVDGMEYAYLAFNNLNLSAADIERVKGLSATCENASRVIFDFRNCKEGSVESASSLASLVLPRQYAGEVFARLKYNAQNSDRDTAYMFDKSLVTAGMERSELFVLTGTTTAGASEIFVNSLKPYMTVCVIGDKTAGNNMYLARFTCPVDEAYTIYPAVAQVCDRDGKSNFSNGFAPDSVVTLEQLAPVYELGSTDEALLKAAFIFVPKQEQQQ